MENIIRCNVYGCEKKVEARKMCRAHYRRFIKTGSTYINPHGRKGLVYGVGFNDAIYHIQPTINGNRTICPYYDVWASMLQRCYSPVLHKKRPTYKGCEVSEDWKTFMNFRSWMMFQDWRGNDLDKDLLVPGNKIYSPETCVFVSQHVNTLLCDNRKRRGEYPIGVCWHTITNKFRAAMSFKGKRMHIGLYDTAHEAHEAYVNKKYGYILQVAKAQIDFRVRRSLVDFAEKLKRDLKT